MKTKLLSKETKATLELLIHEIQEILDFPHLRVSQLDYRIRNLLDSWIRGNQLHPEQVITILSNTASLTINNSRWDVTSTDGQWHTINFDFK